MVPGFPTQRLVIKTASESNVMRQYKSLALLFFIWWGGCTSDAVFVVDLASNDGLAGQEANIQRVRATLSNNGTQDVLIFPEDGPVAVPLPTDFSFSLPKELNGGEVEVFVEVLDASQNVIGIGSGSAVVAQGQRTRFLIDLTPP
jgi:hypothetical protein